MSRPHVDQLDRDALDDHNLVDHEMAGDTPEERNAPAATEALQQINYPNYR